MEKKIAYVGIDYHLNSLSIAVMVEGEKNLSQIMREALKMIFRFCFHQDLRQSWVDVNRVSFPYGV